MFSKKIPKKLLLNLGVIGVLFLSIMIVYLFGLVSKSVTGKVVIDMITTGSSGDRKSATFIPKGETLDMHFDRSKLATSTYTVPDTLHQNGMNVIFVSDGFESREAFKNAALFLEESLKTVEPWKSYTDFNFFTVYTDTDQVCHVEVENHRKPTLRCSPVMNSYIIPLQLYRFKAVVISRSDFTSWSNLVRLDNSMVAYSLPVGTESQTLQRKIFLHEFSHGFGLRDEMTKSVIALAGSEATKAGGPNCAPDIQTALKWWGDLVQKNQNGQYYFEGASNMVGFYYGCAGSEYFIKPTTGSLLNLQDSTHNSDSYGPVSERYLKKVLQYCFSPKMSRIKDDPVFFETYPEFKGCVEE